MLLWLTPSRYCNNGSGQLHVVHDYYIVANAVVVDSEWLLL